VRNGRPIRLLELYQDQKKKYIPTETERYGENSVLDKLLGRLEELTKSSQIIMDGMEETTVNAEDI